MPLAYAKLNQVQCERTSDKNWTGWAGVIFGGTQSVATAVRGIRCYDQLYAARTIDMRNQLMASIGVLAACNSIVIIQAKGKWRLNRNILYLGSSADVEGGPDASTRI